MGYLIIGLIMGGFVGFAIGIIATATDSINK